jgi:hypothetical protein
LNLEAAGDLGCQTGTSSKDGGLWDAIARFWMSY